MTMQRITEVCPKYLSETAESVVPGGYKQTEIGVIPEDWELLPMSHLTTLMTNGFVGTAKSHYTDSQHGITYIQGYNVEENGFNYHGIKKVTPEFHKKNAKSCLRTGDVLMVQTGDVGLVTIVPPELEGANCHALIINRFKPEYDSKYFAFLLNSTQGRQRLKELEIGTTMKHINVGDLLHFTVPFPKVKKEQTAIATALSDVDALITELEKLIIKKQAIKTATMQQLLTGKTRLPEFTLREDGSKKGYKQSELGEIPEDWEIRTVYELAENQKSQFDDGDWVEAEHITDKGIRLIQTGNIGIGHYVEKDAKKYIYPASFEKLKCKELHEGDLLICRLAEPAGRACILPDIGEQKVITSVDVTIFRPSAYLADRQFYVQYFSFDVWFKSILEQVGGTTHKRISRGALGKISIPYPSLQEQTAIATILSDMDKELQLLEKRLNKTRQIKQGMMQELLTGKTRLVKPEGDHHGSA